MNPRLPGSPPAWFAPLLALMLMAGIGLTVWVMWQSFVALPSHMPEGAFAIYGVPGTPSANPMKLYESYRIFPLHVASAMSAAMVSGIMALAGILYLVSRKTVWDALIVAAVEVGVVTFLITMVTGYFWGEFAWGKGWTWEPRLTSALILWLSYVALLVLRTAVSEPEQRRRFTAIYGLATVPLYPLVSKSIKLFGSQSHPPSLESLLGDNPISRLYSMALPALMLLFLSFILLRCWQLVLRERVGKLRQRLARE